MADIYFAVRKLMVETVPKENVQFALAHLDTIIKDMGRMVDKHRSDAAAKIQDILLGPKDDYERKPKKRRR